MSAVWRKHLATCLAVTASCVSLAASVAVASSLRRRRKQRRRPWLHAEPRKVFPFAPPMGTMNLRIQSDEPHWLDVDREYCLTLELKRVLILAKPHQVLAELDSADVSVAAQEALQAIVQELEERYPNLVCRQGKDVCNLATGRVLDASGSRALLAAAELVQEDLIVMLPRGETFVFAQGVVCFSDRWSIPEKHGKTLREIHDPVKAYPRVAEAVERLFQGLRVADGTRIRYNFTFQRCGVLHNLDIPDAQHADATVYVRVERQGLRALPSGGVLFTLRTYTTPLDELPERVKPSLRAVMRKEVTTSLGVGHIDRWAPVVLAQLS